MTKLGSVDRSFQKSVFRLEERLLILVLLGVELIIVNN